MPLDTDKTPFVIENSGKTGSAVSRGVAGEAAGLFTPARLGGLVLGHRVIHAPTTRLRALADETPSSMMVEYYRQRASLGGLIITESAHPSYDSRGYLGAPGIYTDAHLEGWRRVTDAVHAKGGLIVMQIAHDGRQSHVDLSGGMLPIAPSVVPFEGQAFTQDGWVPVSPHRALELGEIPALIDSFRRGAERAREAGFDGIELHNANGYLADTFLQDGTNRRTDAYGGSIENRMRFGTELTEALIAVFGADRVGVRVSPSGTWGAISDSDPETTFGRFAERLSQYGLAYLHIIEPRVSGVETIHKGQAPVACAFVRQVFTGPIIAAGGFDRAGAEAILRRGDADAVAFGRYFTSNPDLPERFRQDLPLTPYCARRFLGW